MKPILLVLAVAFVGGVALYGKNQRPFWIFQAVMLPVFLYFFGADVMQIPGFPGAGVTTSSLWFLPFVLAWMAGTAAFGVLSLKHLLKKEPT
ncbi:MAG: hypothetical protein AAF230_09400 [Pseudomonadota bacterium]